MKTPSAAAEKPGDKQASKTAQKKAQQLEKLRRTRAEADKLVEVLEGASFHQAGAGIAASQLFELLQDFDSSSLKELLKESPEAYTRFVNTLSRLSDGQLKFDNYKAEVAERKARLERELASVRIQCGLSLETLGKIEKELQLF